MYTPLIQEKAIQHAERHRRKRLDRKKFKERNQRRIDWYRLISGYQTLTDQEETGVFHPQEEETRLVHGKEQYSYPSYVDNERKSVDDQKYDNPIGEPEDSSVRDDDNFSWFQSDNNDEVEYALGNGDRSEPTRELPLHDHTNISMLDFCENFSSFLRKAQMNKSHSSDLLKLIKTLLPVPNHMPSTVKDLFSLLDVKDLFTKRSVCLLCKTCLEYGKNKCSTCQSLDPKTIADIYDIDIRLVLETIIKRLSSEIEQYKHQIKYNINRDQANDIPFNTLYQQLLKRNRDKNLISLLLHLDGIALTKSTKLKMWLFSGSLIELPPRLRYRRYNMVVLSIWIGYFEPETDLWLKPVVGELKYLKSRDIMVKESSYKLIIYGITGDCPALKKILNFIGHNGYDCCWFCYLHGQHVNGKRQYFYERPIILRSAQNYLHDSNEAHRTRSRVNGHLGKSVIADLLDIPLPDSVVIDYLHVTLLGHVKSIVVNIYNELTPLNRSIYNDELKKQSFPHWFKRKFRPFTEFANIKAVELRNLLFYGVLPYLQTKLSLDKLAHLALYVCSIRLLHGYSIFGNETSKIADELISKFYEDHEQYYQDLQNYVLHLHIHYPAMYKNHGSLTNIGCFGQEDLIGKISSEHHGTCYYGSLITYYYNIDFSIHNSRRTVDITDGPEDPSNEHADRYERMDQYHSRLCIGCIRLNECCTMYRRSLIQRQMFHSLIYNKRKNSNSYFVQYWIDNDIAKKRFGIIQFFFTCMQAGYAVIEYYPVHCLYSEYFEQSKYYDLLKKPLDSFFFVLEKYSRQEELVNTSWIKSHCILIEMHNTLLVTPVSTYDEHD